MENKAKINKKQVNLSNRFGFELKSLPSHYIRSFYRLFLPFSAPKEALVGYRFGFDPILTPHHYILNQLDDFSLKTIPKEPFLYINQGFTPKNKTNRLGKGYNITTFVNNNGILFNEKDIESFPLTKIKCKNFPESICFDSIISYKSYFAKSK